MTTFYSLHNTLLYMMARLLVWNIKYFILVEDFVILGLKVSLLTLLSQIYLYIQFNNKLVTIVKIPHFCSNVPKLRKR